MWYMLRNSHTGSNRESCCKNSARILQEGRKEQAEENYQNLNWFHRREGLFGYDLHLRQLAEKSFEHIWSPSDFQWHQEKTYDSIPHVAMWIVLQKLGVRDQIADLIQLFHYNLQAQIRIGGSLSEEIDVMAWDRDVVWLLYHSTYCICLCCNWTMEWTSSSHRRDWNNKIIQHFSQQDEVQGKHHE